MTLVFNYQNGVKLANENNKFQTKNSENFDFYTDLNSKNFHWFQKKSVTKSTNFFFFYCSSRGRHQIQKILNQ